LGVFIAAESIELDAVVQVIQALLLTIGTNRRTLHLLLHNLVLASSVTKLTLAIVGTVHRRRLEGNGLWFVGLRNLGEPGLLLRFVELSLYRLQATGQIKHLIHEFQVLLLQDLGPVRHLLQLLVDSLRSLVVARLLVLQIFDHPLVVLQLLLESGSCSSRSFEI